MTKNEHIRAAQRQLTLALGTAESIDRRKKIIDLATSDHEFWQKHKNNPGRLESFRRGVLVMSGWDFDWSNNGSFNDTGECSAFASRWWRAAGLYIPESRYTHEAEDKGTFFPIDRRTATAFDMKTVFQKWGCWHDVSEIENAKPGDLLVTTDVSTGHACIVRKVVEGAVLTIEANYSDQIMMVRRTDMSKIVGFGSVD